MTTSSTSIAHSQNLIKTIAAIAAFMLAAGIVTSSIDILLTLNLGGANTRLIYFLTLSATLLTIKVAWERRRLVWPYAFGLIFAWVGINSIFIPNSPSLIRGLLYGLVLVVSLALIWNIAQIFDTPQKKRWLLRVYLWSFVGHSIIGITQLLASSLGFDVLSQQNDEYGRLNGLTHEPSAFAAFEITGYVLLRELLRRRVQLFSKLTTWSMLLTTAVALILSTSKTAWLFMMIYEVIIAVLVLLKTITTRRVDMKTILLYSVLMAAGFFFISTLLLEPDLLISQIAFSGTGISGGPSHSFDDRFARTLHTIQAAQENSFIGTSYGGVGPYIHQKIMGIYDVNVPLSQLSDSMFTPAEVWAGTGFIGFLVWIAFLFLLSVRFRDFKTDYFNRHVLGALTFSAWIGLGASTSDFTRATTWAHLALWVLFSTKSRISES